jgi:hypothetical protein
MVGDLKTGHLLGASPRSQFLAQCVGSVFAIAAAVPLFLLYTQAYKCIIDPTIEKCEFGLISVLTWQNVCKILTVSKEKKTLLHTHCLPLTRSLCCFDTHQLFSSTFSTLFFRPEEPFLVLLSSLPVSALVSRF